ncbi:hypothetical protein AVL62_00405 [Serinicoccus chungangensis]|uniref:GAF domain-containing protein n=1 Tax=Serinicoccus chungangensis TaxID=767452 RepID=A0A0W8I4W4_9MICO|nr:GAF domain-containing protein [Serinicoccus chungangensis]KUG53309.1 hypothetical protein AVL62_00405 [Serinicoccus chungangensis]
MTEDDRVGALQRLDVLDAPTEGRFDRVIRLAQQLFDVPVVAVNMVDAQAQHTIAALGMDCGSVPLADSFCAHTIRQAETLVVPDVMLDARFRHTALVAGDPHVRFYAGHPLRAPGGQAVGSLCLAGPQARQFDATQQRLLADLASWVEEELVRSDDRLEAEQGPASAGAASSARAGGL